MTAVALDRAGAQPPLWRSMTSRGVAGIGVALLGAVLSLAPARAAAQRRPTVARIQVSPPDGQVDVGKTITFYATAYDPTNNLVESATSFTWTSSNAHASIDQYGNATGVSAGVTIITARYGTGTRARTSQVTLTVTPPGTQPQPQAATQPTAPSQPRGARGGAACAAQERQPEGSGPAEGLVVNPLQLVLVKGESQQLQFRAVRADGANADRVCIQFSIDPGGERVAQVDSFGLVTSVGDTGHAMLRAVVPGTGRWPPKQIAIEVRGDSVRFSQGEVSLPPGAQDTLQVVVPAENNRALNPAMFQFVSSDTTRVRVSPVLPVVTAIAPGSARVTASSSVYPDIHATVTVHKPVVRLAGTPASDSITVAINGSLRLGYRLIAADSTAVEGVPIRWDLPDTTLARFDTATLTVRGVRPGNTVVTLHALTDRDHERFQRWYVRVVAGGLQMETPRLGIELGGRRALAVSLLDEARRPLGPAAARWTTSDSSVARVSDAQAVAVAMGHAVLEARSPWDSTATADVYVVGDLLVVGSKGGRWGLYMVDRSEPTRAMPLSQDSGLVSQPAWARDWRHIAYTVTAHGRPSGSALYVANADGSGAVRVTQDSGAVRRPCFVGPDGDRIVFESTRGGGKPQLYVVGRDGSARRQLTGGDAPNSQPDVSPDGRKVLFTSLRAQNYDIYEIGLDGTGEQRLTADPRPDDSPQYAADGKSFYFLQLDGGKPPTKRVYRQDLTPGALPVPVTPIGLYVQAYSVSADGRTLALTLLEESPDGRSVARVVLYDAGDQSSTPLAVPGLDALAWPAFRPPPSAPAAAAAAPASH